MYIKSAYQSISSTRAFMKLHIIAIGNKLPAWVQTGVNEYHKRLSPMIKTEITELAPSKRHKNPSPADILKYKQQEGGAILSHVKGKLWVLDVKGKMLSTEALSVKLDEAMTNGENITLVIGGADGVDDKVLSCADFRWSISDLTLPHPLVRVILLEQLYRATSILHNHPYHRGE